MVLKYDVIVVGAGHAGCEAAAAAANMGAKTCLVTIDMNKIGQMSCNPAIGGIAKGQIVREIDALGGFTGIVTDRSSLQFRMLNSSKGPAMWSPRAQCDRVKFIETWKDVLMNTPNLSIWQDHVKELIVESGCVLGVKTYWDVEIYGRAVIITSGTFLNGLMHIGRNMLAGGRCGEPASNDLTNSITSLGITSGRMKTGTPVRIDGRTVHFEDLNEQECNMTDSQFSYFEKRKSIPNIPCWEAHTNKECHEILRKGLVDSPLYNGQIQSIGPRYCPSIETKLHTFADKDSHPLFLEPEGENSQEYYLNGFSSSLPIDIQIEALRKIPAFRDVQVYRPGYAIEYDYFDPTQLKHTLESKIVEGLFFAGQVNGTTGYEEAAGQGVIAGINAALKCSGNREFILHRDEAYIGVLIDDLVLKGVDEPYRMFTSRAEYRLLLRQDNADMRLTEKSYNIGLASQERYNSFIDKKNRIEIYHNFLSSNKVIFNNINEFLSSINVDPLSEGCSLENLLVKPDVKISDIEKYIMENILNNVNYQEFWKITTAENLLEDFSLIRNAISETVEIDVKYKYYIDREQVKAERLHKFEKLSIKDKFDYDSLTQLTIEARQKLKLHQPSTIAEASRIPGISPADINILLVLLGR